MLIAPSWPEIHASDAERKQSPDEAERTDRAVAAAYPAYGNELVELPGASVAPSGWRSCSGTSVGRWRPLRLRGSLRFAAGEGEDEGLGMADRA